MPTALIVGAGMAGLSAALHLSRAGLNVTVLEASDGVGGRVRSDSVEDFTLNRGFQVFPEAYPEARALLDYNALDLRRFYNGALLRSRGRFHRFADPAREPLAVLSMLGGPGNFSDYMTLSALRGAVTQGSLEQLFSRPEVTTAEHLGDLGFSAEFVDVFMRPFFGGVFFERELTTSSRMFEFVFRMFCQGSASLPADGMQAIPQQLAERIGTERIRLGCRAESISAGGVTLADGETLSADALIVATEAPAAERLLSGRLHVPAMRAVTTLYFAAEAAPLSDALLLLNGEGFADGPLNDACVISNVAPEYAPEGQHLISGTVLGDPGLSDGELAGSVLEQFERWFGQQVRDWRLLRVYRIREALPAQDAPALFEPARSARLEPGLYVCGDHRETASLNGAMASGRRAGEAVLEDLGLTTAAE